MEYSSDKVMTRKAYLKSKKKGKFGIRIIKYGLLLIVVVLLSIYLFKQLDIYNNVTKIANKVVEETALSKTMTMYYSADGYTKDALKSVVLYKSFDESRTKLEGTEGFSNIKIYDGILYGIFEEKLYKVNLETSEKVQVCELSLKDYIVYNRKIYCYVEKGEAKEKGIYVYEGENKEPKLLINITVQQFLVDDNYIFVISKGKTEKSVIRYNLNGSGRTIITDKEIVTYMKQDKNNIYYVVGEQLYSVKKSAKDNILILDETIYIDSDIKSNTSQAGAFEIKGDNIYYIIKADEKKLYSYNMKTKEKQEISKKNVESMQLLGNILYYKINDGIEIYKLNIENGKTEYITNIRGSEYICFN